MARSTFFDEEDHMHHDQNLSTSNEKVERFEDRMRRRKAEENIRAAQHAEELRQDYLRRTGRKELKP